MFASNELYETFPHTLEAFFEEVRGFFTQDQRKKLGIQQIGGTGLTYWLSEKLTFSNPEEYAEVLKKPFYAGRSAHEEARFNQHILESEKNVIFCCHI